MAFSYLDRRHNRVAIGSDRSPLFTKPIRPPSSLSSNMETFFRPLELGLNSLYKRFGLRHRYSIMSTLTEPAPQGGLDERRQVISSLKGKQVRIPDLNSLFESWPEATSPQLPALRLDVERTVEK